MIPHTVGPFSSGEMPIADTSRIEDIESKHQRIREFLTEQQLDAVLLQQPENFSWLTSGGDNTGKGFPEPKASIFVTSDARVVLGGNSDLGQLFDTEITGLGFQLKERPWYEPRQVLMADLCRGRRVGSDAPLGKTIDVSEKLAGMRVPLTPVEADRIRKLGRQLAHALEATARNLQRLQTESEVAGEVAHRLMKHEIDPVQIQVTADTRTTRYRHWGYSGEPVRRWCVLRAVGKKWGLHVSAARTVSLDVPDQELLRAHQHAALVQATAIYFSQRNWALGDVLDKTRRIYEKFDHADEWRLAEQGHVQGYRPSEIPVIPRSEYRLAANTSLYWRPSIGPAQLGDSILLNSEGFEMLTPIEVWPSLEVAVKEVPIVCPGILIKG